MTKDVQQTDIDRIIEFLKAHNRFYHAAQIGILYDRYQHLKEKSEDE